MGTAVDDHRGATRQEPQRRDAQRNREAILAAARELFAECADVPMYEVARKAGVGQATLYRNFPDRRNLAAAVLKEHMERTEEIAAEHRGDPDTFFLLLRHMVERMARFYSLSELAREDACLGSELERRRRRLGELMKEALREAKVAGLVRNDLTIDDVFLIIGMIKGAMEGAEGPAGRAAAGGRALSLALAGLGASRPTESDQR